MAADGGCPLAAAARSLTPEATADLPIVTEKRPPELPAAFCILLGQFPIRKEGIFCPGKEIERLRGGVRPYAATRQARRLTPPGQKSTLSGRKLVVFPQQFEMRLRMVAGGAAVGGTGAMVEVAAVTAAPGDLGIPLKDPVVLDIGHQVQVALFVLFFRHGNRQENSRQSAASLPSGRSLRNRDTFGCARNFRRRPPL